MTGATATKEKKSKKGFFGRFKKKKESKKASKKDETELPTPPPSPEPQEEAPRQSNKKSKMSVSKTGVPIVTGDNPDDFNPSDVKQTSPNEPAVSSKSMKKSQKKSKKKRGPRDNSVILDKAPTARDSAFSGPPRYDWIDVVSCRPSWWDLLGFLTLYSSSCLYKMHSRHLSPEIFLTFHTFTHS